MKELFTAKSFNAEHRDIISNANSIVTRYQAQGYDLSLRQLYYQFIATSRPNGEAWFPNSEQSYKRLGGIISDARLAGMVDWAAIRDRAREVNAAAHWDSPASILDSAAYGFRMDSRKDQPNEIIVMVEKDALSGVLYPVCRDQDIRFTANKGYASSSHLYDIGKHFDRANRKGKKAHVIYLGDHDPSGIDMTRDVWDRLELFARCPVEVHRVALNMDQVEQYGPPENPAKLTDSRANGYIDKYGDSSWELDALEPSVLAALVNDIVDSLTDKTLREAIVNDQEKYKIALHDIADKFRNPEPDGDDPEDGDEYDDEHVN